MGCTPEAVEAFTKAKFLFAPVRLLMRRVATSGLK